MERLDGPLAELVSAEREQLASEGKAPEAAWAAVAAAWEAPPVPPPGGGAAEATAAAGKTTALKLVGALVVGTTVAAGGWVATNQPAERAAVARVEAPRVEPSVEPAPAAARDDAPVLVPPPSAPAPAAEAPRVATPKPIPAAPVPGLAEELALVDEMRRHVAAGRHADALVLARRHRKVFAKGSLTADRMDLEAAARCGSGDLETGRALAERKKKRWPRAPISDRLRKLCRLEVP